MSNKTVAALVLAAFSGFAFAEANEDFAKFTAADADADGVLTQAEAEQVEGLAERFQELDADADGKLTRSEYAQAMSGQSGAEKKG